MLATGRRDRRVETRLGAFVVRVRQVQLSPEAVQLGLVNPLFGLIRMRERLVEFPCAVVEPAGLGVRGAPEPEVNRDTHHAQGAKVAELALEQGERLGPAPLLDQGVGPEQSGIGQPMREIVFGRDG